MENNDRDGSNVPPTSVEAPALPNLMVRLLQVFVSPGTLFERLKQRPAWLAALLLVVGLSLAAGFLVPQELILKTMTQNLPPNAPPDAAQKMAAFARISRYFPIVMVPAWIAVLAGVLMLIFNVILGGAARYKQLFSFTTHAMLIPTIGSLAMLPLMLKKGVLSSGLTLDALIPGLQSGYVFRFLKGVNAFSVWAVIVLAVGISKLYPNRTTRSAATILIVLYLAVVAVVAAVSRGGG